MNDCSLTVNGRAVRFGDGISSRGTISLSFGYICTKHRHMKKTALSLILTFLTIGLFAQNRETSSGDYGFPKVPSIENLQHPWQGKKVAILGDSISDPRLGRISGNKLYWSYLQDWLQLEIYNYAVSGMQWNDIPRQVSQLEKEHSDDVDAILILMGTNDYNMGIPPGEWFTETEEWVLAGTDMRTPATQQLRKRRSLVMDNSTVRGRINIAMKMIKEKYPRCAVVLMTPLHRGNFIASEGNVQPEESYQNRIGEYLDAYVEAVREAGGVWSVDVVDLYSVSNMNPIYGQSFYYGGENDLLHPGPEGSRHLATVLYYRLLSIAVKDL